MVKRDGRTSFVWFAAPTAEEILRRLPLVLDIHAVVDDRPRMRALKIIPSHPNRWKVSYENILDQTEDSLANAAAAMYCYLAENNLFPLAA